MPHHRSLIRRAALALALLAACAPLAACGSSASAAKKAAGASSSTTSATGAGRGRFFAERTKLESCLKQHGVSLPAFHRPATGSGGPPASGGFFGAPGAGRPHAGAFANPKLRAALRACGANFSHRRGAFFTQSAGFRTRLDSFIACVKKHGYTLPKPNLSGTGPVFPASIEKNARFQAAAKACASLLRRPASAGTGAGGSSG